MAIHALPDIIKDGYEIHEWRHASAILASDFPDELSDICDVLGMFRLCKTFLQLSEVESRRFQRESIRNCIRKGG